MEEQNQMEREHSEKKKGGRAFIIFILILSLLGNGYLIFDYIQEQKDDKELLKLAQEAGLSLDSLKAEYDAINAQYNDLLNNSGFVSDSLRSVIENQKVEILKLFNDLKTRPSWNRLNIANVRVKAFENENNELKRVNDSLTVSNAEYQRVAANWKNNAENLYKDAQKMKLEKADLESKVEKVNFSINEFTVSPVRIKRSGREQTFKTNRVDELDISFTVVGNELMSKGKKEIRIRIIGTNNEVLGANNDILTESSKLASMVEPFEYDGKSQDFNLTFKQEEKWKSGQHTVELIHKGQVIDRVAFILD